MAEAVANSHLALAATVQIKLDIYHSSLSYIIIRKILQYLLAECLL